MGVMAIAVLALIVLNIVAPSVTSAGKRAISKFVGRVSSEAESGQGNDTTAQQAHFTNVDGTVRVKKANSNTWVAADYTLPLEKGDVIQTASEGMARVVFNDGTNYTIKQDSLIVIEENSATAQQTQVAVNVTTGTVDLSTAMFNQGSSSKVTVAGATASLAPESTAMVHNDPHSDQHEILLKKGAGEVSRDGQVVHLSDFEKVSFTGKSASMTKHKEVGPPTLVSPANMMPIFSTGPARSIDFSWTPVPGSAAYRLRISKNPYFSSTLIDHRVPDAQVEVPGLGEGAYYWEVHSIDNQGRESVESERNRFTIIPKGNEQVSIALQLDPFVQHGHVIEVMGKTDPSARVMVNGREVALVANDGTFHYFTPPLPMGESVITVTAQNARGGVNTQQQKVVIQ
jgi:hypothetical protein